MVNQSDAFYILLLIGMWLVTLVPRIAPPFFWRADKVPPKLSFALALIPFAVLGVLIVPGVFVSMEETPLLATIAALPVAIGLAFYRANLVLIVLASILVHYGLSVLIAAPAT